MDLNLGGRSALVTGGSKGIGRAAAERLAAEGCDLVLVARGAGDLEAARAAIAAKANVQVKVVAADLSIASTVAALADRFPAIDILVNNAGAIPRGDLAEIDEARWSAAWALKVLGYVNMCRAYYALMKARGSGVIVNIIGAAAQNRDPQYICGVAGNAALTAFTQALGSASPADGVRVLGVNPGPVATGRMETQLRKRALDETGDAENWRDLVAPMPFGRAATPEEIGAAIAFLASERSAYTSGAILTIDAGASARHA
ncbi:MAG: short-chain dehydrogenase/reductase [Roseiarcus sp.]|jgi:3-oxoacyl-[acyl-carrier protein] reductase